MPTLNSIPMCFIYTTYFKHLHNTTIPFNLLEHMFLIYLHVSTRTLIIFRDSIFITIKTENFTDQNTIT